MPLCAAGERTLAPIAGEDGKASNAATLMATATLKAKESVPRTNILLQLAGDVSLLANGGQCAATRSFASSSGDGKAMADIGSTQTR
jgi:hypothetical protein